MDAQTTKEMFDAIVHQLGKIDLASKEGVRLGQTRLVDSITLTRQARAYLTIIEMATSYSKTTAGRLVMEINRRRKAGEQIVCVLANGWTIDDIEACEITIEAEMYPEPNLEDGDFLVVAL